MSELDLLELIRVDKRDLYGTPPFGHPVDSVDRPLAPLPVSEKCFGLNETRTREILNKLLTAEMHRSKHWRLRSEYDFPQGLKKPNTPDEVVSVIDCLVSTLDVKDLFSFLATEFDGRWLERVLAPYEWLLLYHESRYSTGDWLKELCNMLVPDQLFQSVKQGQWHWDGFPSLHTTFSKLESLIRADRSVINGFQLRVLYTRGCNERGYTENEPMGKPEFIDADLGILITHDNKPVAITGFFFGVEGGVYLNQLQGATRSVGRINRLGADWRAAIIDMLSQVFEDDIYLCNGEQAVKCYDKAHTKHAVREIRERIYDTYNRDISGYTRLPSPKKGYYRMVKTASIQSAA